MKQKYFEGKVGFQIKRWPYVTCNDLWSHTSFYWKNLHLHNCSIHINLYQNQLIIECVSKNLAKSLEGRKDVMTEGSKEFLWDVEEVAFLITEIRSGIHQAYVHCTYRRYHILKQYSKVCTIYFWVWKDGFRITFCSDLMYNRDIKS